MKETKAPGLGWAITSIVLFSSIPVTLMSSAVSPVLPKILTTFADYPNAAMLTKQVMGVASVAAAIGCLVGSWLANRCNHRSVLISAYSSYLFAGGLGFVLSDLYLLLASRAVVGLSAAIVSTVTLVVLSERADGNRRDSFLGALVCAALISAVIAFPAAGFLGNINWRLVFLIYLLPTPILVACFFMPHSRTQVPIVESAVKTPFSLPYRVMLMGFMCAFVASLPSVYLPFRFRDIGIEDSRIISLHLTIVTVVGAVLSALYGRIRRTLDIYQSLTISYGLVACGLMIVALAPALPIILVGAFIQGCGMGPLAPNIFALATQLPAQERARAIGLVKAIMYGAPGFGILVLEPIARTFGNYAALGTISVFSFAVAAYVLIDRAPYRDISKLANDQPNQAAA